ncbi:MAG: hypothetical protein K2H61_03255 [Muribaculaceae bacterium]|nr:hypothetical protein [Muribaculaceae bacterium]
MYSCDNNENVVPFNEVDATQLFNEYSKMHASSIFNHATRSSGQREIPAITAEDVSMLAGMSKEEMEVFSKEIISPYTNDVESFLDSISYENIIILLGISQNWKG